MKMKFIGHALFLAISFVNTSFARADSYTLKISQEFAQIVTKPNKITPAEISEALKNNTADLLSSGILSSHIFNNFKSETKRAIIENLTVKSLYDYSFSEVTPYAILSISEKFIRRMTRGQYNQLKLLMNVALAKLAYEESYYVSSLTARQLKSLIKHLTLIQDHQCIADIDVLQHLAIKIEITKPVVTSQEIDSLLEEVVQLLQDIDRHNHLHQNPESENIALLLQELHANAVP